MKFKLPSFLHRGDWPCDPAKFPIFYGWVILGCTILGVLMSVPGQTVGLSMFNEPVRLALDLSATQYAVAYMLGTIASSLLLGRAGKLYDRMGARLLIAGTSIGLAATLLFLSQVDRMSWGVHSFTGIPAGVTSFGFIFLAFFMVRFFGQGVLTMASTNMVMQWFDRKRGRVNGIQVLFVAYGFALSPTLMKFLIDRFGWREAWMILAGVIGIGFVTFTLIFARNTPESCGLQPDGDGPEEDDGETKDNGKEPKEYTLDEARKIYSFWIYSFALALYALIMTAVTFNVLLLFDQAGRTADEARFMFIPLAICSTSTNFIASSLSDFIRLRYILWTMLVAFLAGTVGQIYLASDWGYWLFIGSYGFGAGMWGVLVNVTWPRYFGRLHLGSIRGLFMSMLVFGSALGPALYSVSYDQFATFAVAQWVCLVAFAVLLVLALPVRNPREG